MKIIRLNESEVFKNGNTCEVNEYPFNDPDINIGTAKINGRFPESGYLVNEIVKEYVYVVDGSGQIVTESQTIEFNVGDVVYIPVGEPYYWKAHCFLVMPCQPAWSPEQSRNIQK
jgi:mannose-6-phosphate isomerase-like protein (cupin superfamily)